MNTEILVIEDDDLVRQGIVDILELKGWNAVAAKSCSEALVRIRGEEYMLYVLDMKLPDGNGIMLCREIRRYTDNPILFLSAYDSEEFIVEGFEEKDINLSRYSLSTKAADALASGASILTYGSLESGIIEYMQSTNAAMVCTDKAKLVDSITQLISNQELQKKYYEQAIVMTREHHNLQASCKTSENVVAKAIQHMK